MLLGQFHDFTLRFRPDHAAAGDDHRPRCRGERRKRVANALHFRLGAERRDAPVSGFDQRIELGFLLGHLAQMALDAKVDRARSSGGRDAKRLPQQVRHARYAVDLRVKFGERVKLRHVIDFLIRVPVARLRGRTAGDRDDRRTRHEAVAQSRREVRRAYHLCHADARFSARAGVAIGHIGSRLLAMHHHAMNRHVFHLGEGFEHERRNKKNVRDTIALHHFGEQPRPCHLRHYVFSLG